MEWTEHLHLNLHWRRRLPLIRQTESAECGGGLPGDGRRLARLSY
ncbi:Uncharacterised protein [Serratia fonticola]|uniref:Uncharacterized protein n=1 Tax=Serratia fonticola TaxID=47917 RepID=A0A4U9WDP8_SERFO|nr:Uncharacterised protein [Serratia fonticola]